MKIRSLILFLSLGACARVPARPPIADPASTGAIPPLWMSLVPGPHKVGYVRQDNANGRVHVWYPARASGSAMSVGSYLQADTTRLAAFLTQAKVSDATVKGLLASTMFATGRARPTEQQFPLVLVAQGNAQDVFDQVVLCEYLASYGFVVATTPSPMVRTPMTSEEQVGTRADEQATELREAIRSVATSFRVDTSRIGVVGHSFGARAALLLAMNDARIKAIVSLDGGIGTATATTPFMRAPSFRANAPLPPLLHFYEELDDFMKPDLSLIGSLRFELTSTVRHSGMRHVHFTTYGLAAGQFQDLALLTRAVDVTAQEAADVYRMTRDFLERRVRMPN